MRGVRQLILVMTILSSIALLGLEAQGAAQTFRAGFVFNTPLGDPGWTTRQNAGRVCLQQRLPWVQTSFVENVPEGADAERVITQLARAGNQLVVAANFGYMDTVIGGLQDGAEREHLPWPHVSGAVPHGDRCRSDVQEEPDRVRGGRAHS
jgi:basic membrane lipoprotein Med (substrate-binding protein (PBP1-ABC) superfamily)